MRRCALSRFRSRRTGDGRGVEGDSEVVDDEKRTTRRPRDWSAIALTAIRLLQFGYFAFAYYTLRSFRRSSDLHKDGPLQHLPDELRHSGRMMRWAKMQFSVTLIYHAAVLVVPCLLRLVRATRRPVAGLATLFGDGCAMMAMLNTLVMLDSAHEGYCHSLAAKSDFDLREVFGLSKGSHRGTSSRRAVCRSLDVIFALGGLIILSYSVTAIVTAWRAKRSSPAVCAKVEPASDVEQGILQRPNLPAPSAPTTPRGRHSPPPPYDPMVAELAQRRASYAERPPPTPTTRSRSSTETTSSLGYERYLVSDGWRAPEGPPEYSSRPPSLHHAVL